MFKLVKILNLSLFVTILISAIALVILPIQTHAALPLFGSNFTKINENGFGDSKNSYPWSMEWFNGKLYVGTGRQILEARAFASNPPNLNPYPVIVPPNFWELDLQGEIWEYTPETDTWQIVFKSDLVQFPFPGGNQPTARDVGYRCMIVYQDALYIPTTSFLPYIPARILHTTDGVTFTPFAFNPGMPLPPNMTISSFRAIVEFNGKLYTTPVATDGGGQQSEIPVVFELVDIDTDNKIMNFQPVSPAGFNDPDNVTIFEMAVFNGYLYAGTGNGISGFQVWKTDAVGSPYVWTKIITDGAYRGPRNEGVASMYPFKGCLYIGSGIQGGGSDVGAGIFGPAELLRLYPDDTWDIVCGTERDTPVGHKAPISGFPAGFGNLFTGYFWRMEEYGDVLYLATFDNSTMLAFNNMSNVLPEIRDMVDRIGGIDKVVMLEGGFDLWGTMDGVIWYPITKNGFDNPCNYGGRTMKATPSGLFVGAANPFTQGALGFPGGAEVWLGQVAGIIGIIAQTPRPLSIVPDQQPFISAAIIGDSSKIVTSSIKMVLDGVVVPHQYNVAKQLVYYVPPEPLDIALHCVEVFVNDIRDREYSNLWRFTIGLPTFNVTEYRYGQPSPGYKFNGKTFESWLDVKLSNLGPGDAYNVKASIMKHPVNVKVIDGEVSFGDVINPGIAYLLAQWLISNPDLRDLILTLFPPTIAEGSSVWSQDSFTIQIDMSQPQPPNEPIFWKIEYYDVNGGYHVIENIPQISAAPPFAQELPLWYPPEAAVSSLHQNFPNPFNPDTWMPYQLAKDAKNVSIKIFDVKGQLIRTLDLGHKPAGFYTGKDRAAYWDGKNQAGEIVSSGIYFYQIEADDFIKTKKMVISK